MRSSREPRASSPDPLFFSLQELVAGRYSLDAELGRGGMGVVFLARDVQLDRPVALKVLPQILASQAGVRERFLREARTAAKLSHPNIVPIHSVEEVGEFVFFAMSYIAGETLGERVRRRGPMAPSELMRVLREVGWALSYAHSQGVIHRDVKPDNILLEEASGRALVADFGIAGIMDDRGAAGAGEIVGTAEFMSPEQAAGQAVDARSDIYALGMVAYHALTGSVPFHAETVRETLALVQAGEVPSVATMAKAAPRRLTRIVDTCLKPHPDERYQTADKVAEAIDAVTSTRTQVPVAVRNFLYDPIDLGGDGKAYFIVGTMATFPMFLAFLEDPVAGSAVLGLYLTYVLGAPLVVVPPRVRRLLRSGNTLADLEVGLKQDLEQRREEAPLAKPGSWAGWATRLYRGGLVGIGTSWTAYWAAVLLDAVTGSNLGLMMAALGPLGTVFLASTGAAIVGKAGGAGASDRAELDKAARRLGFWRGKLGRWIFKVCGVGLGQRVTQVRATHRPTELQIGLAVEALFEALPKDVRKDLGDVPGVVNELEADAGRLRESIEKLTEAEAAGLPLSLELPADLRATRVEAEQKLSEVVASLETIRLELLRLTAGVGTAEHLTTHLHEAGEVGEQVGHLLAGLDAVEAALRGSGEFESNPSFA